MGRFCLNCGHPIGEPAPAAPVTTAPAPSAAPPVTEAPQQPLAAPEPMAMPVQAADPTPVPPVGRPAPVAEPPAEDETSDEAFDEGEDVAPAAPPPSRHEWDPREELLPYEEAYELDPDSALPSRAWIYWVLGAVLLVGVVFVLLRVFETDDVETASEPTTSETATPDPVEGAETPEESPVETPQAPQGVGKRINLAADASFAVPATAPPTTDFDGNLVAYEASQMGDGAPSTAWRMAGDATGQAVTVTLSQPGVIYRVGLVNGYAKQVAGVDWYPNNRRILAVTWGFEDGSTVTQTFAERPAMQQLKVPPVQSSTVTITITSVTPPGSGNLGRDYTAISEVAINGQRAG